MSKLKICCRGAAVLAGLWLTAPRTRCAGADVPRLTIPASFPARDGTDYGHSLKFIRKTINWNDANINTGVKFACLPVGAYIHSIQGTATVLFNSVTSDAVHMPRRRPA
jgi:hypothetical protein